MESLFSCAKATTKYRFGASINPDLEWKKLPIFSLFPRLPRTTYLKLKTKGATPKPNTTTPNQLLAADRLSGQRFNVSML